MIISSLINDRIIVGQQVDCWERCIYSLCSLCSKIRSVSCPILMVSSEHDEIVPSFHRNQLVQIIQSNPDFSSVYQYSKYMYQYRRTLFSRHLSMDLIMMLMNKTNNYIIKNYKNSFCLLMIISFFSCFPFYSYSTLTFSWLLLSKHKAKVRTSLYPHYALFQQSASLLLYRYVYNWRMI